MPSWCPGSLAPLLAGVLGLSLLCCASPGSQAIVGPDGSPMAHVHCGSEQGLCFRIAGELCPSGYDIKPVLSGNDGNFLVHCRAPSALAQQVAPSCSPPVAAGPPPALMYPWPPPEAGAAARRPTLPPAQQTEIDLGY